MRFEKSRGASAGFGLVVAVAMGRSVLSLANSSESWPPNRKGNWKANHWKFPISKAHSLKEIAAPWESKISAVRASGHCGEKFAHHRRLLSLPNSSVQPIEHAFSSPPFFYRSPVVSCKNVFSIL